MIDKEFYTKLKQGSITANEEKTKERVRALWKTIGKVNQERVLELADLSRPSVERAYKSGRISAKLSVALAEVSDVDPSYITGESDESETFSQELLENFLKNHNYKEMPKQKKQTVRKNKAEAQESVAKEEETLETETLETETLETKTLETKTLETETLETETIEAPQNEAPGEPCFSEMDLKAIINSLDAYKLLAVGKMTEEEAIMLIQGLFLRARFNDEAKKLTDYIKFILTV